MESFEHVVTVMLENSGYVVSTNVKFPVVVVVRKKSGRIERQVHGHEIDIVAARADRLLLGSVKSFFGSKGVSKQGFRWLHGKDHDTQGGYKLFNSARLRLKVLALAAERYGYQPEQVHLTLFVGKFNPKHESSIRRHVRKLRIRSGHVRVFGLEGIVRRLRRGAISNTYADDPVIALLKALQHAQVLLP